MFKNHSLRTLILLSLLLVAGCSNLDFGRSPFSRVSDKVHPGSASTDAARKQAEKEARHARLTQTLERWQSRRGSADRDYAIGPGDGLRIEVLSLETPGKKSVIERTVTRDGMISLPWSDPVKAAGKSAAELEEAIAGVYRDRVLKDPQIVVQVVDYQSSSIVISGAVNAPGVYYLKTSSITVLEVLSMANGLSDDAGNELLILRGQEENASEMTTNNIPSGQDPITIVDLASLIEKGDMRLNLPVENGDVLSVPSEEKTYIYVLGYVRVPGARAFDPNRGMTALNALALAGGLTSQGRAEKSFVMREMPDGGRRVIPLDLAKVARGIRPDLDLEAGDTLVVGSTFFMKLTEFIRPTVGAGMNYTPVP